MAILLIKRHLSRPRGDSHESYLSCEGTRADQKFLRRLLILISLGTWIIDESLAATYLQMGLLILLYGEPKRWLQGSQVRLISSMIRMVAGWDIGHGNYDYCAESDLCPYRHQSAQFALEIFLLVQIDMKGCQ